MSTTGEVLVCPFCGRIPTIQPWHGGGPRKTAVHCEYAHCAANPMVTGSTKSVAIHRWNFRDRDNCTVLKTEAES